MMRYPARVIYIIVFSLCFGTSAGLAHDVGITKARLIQKSDSSYVLEADVTQVLVWAIKAPIFPDRFQVSELEYVNQSGWIVVQATATTTGEPLSARDEILLPWMRNGAAITVQWLDGSVRQGLFLRSLEGIHVPLHLLLPTAQSLRELCVEHFAIGLRHFTFKWIHLLLVGVLVLLSPSSRVFKSLLVYTFGQALSLILVDVGLPGFEILFADILGSLLLLMLSYAAVRRQELNRYLPLLFLFGLLHGMAYAQELTLLEIRWDQRIPALFMFNVALDIGSIGLAALLVMVGKLVRRPRLQTAASYAIGALSVTLLIMLFQEHVVADKTDILNFSSAESATQFALPVSLNAQSGGNLPGGALRLTSPVMSYLSVEPYEVRQEILVQARTAVRFLGENDEGMSSIPIESLEPVKSGILDVIQKANPLFIDEQIVKPDLARADFVTLEPAGVIVRPNPVPESLDNGIIGLTLVYETEGMANEVMVDWRLFSETVQKVEATTTHPFGGATMILSPEENMLQWKNRLSGYRVAVIEEIAVEKEKLPIASAILFLIVFILLIFSTRRKRLLLGRPVLLSVIGLGFVLYPFYRFPVDLAFFSQWKPSAERTSTILDGLLTNAYRSFNVRDEDYVYDRLAMSVMGDQLEKIYIENRRSLELENRGGARAKVDEVVILSINKVARSEDGGFIADAIWTVSGSVNHFGHTHYRRNKNHALVTFVVDDDAWKIKDIELVEEERLL